MTLLATKMMEMPFSMSGLVENVRRLIISHGTHDEVAFRLSAETLVKELSVTNRSGEAKALRDALGLLAQNGKQQESTSMRPLGLTNRNGDPLITFIEPKVRREAVFLSEEASQSFDRVLAEHRNYIRLAEAGLQPRRKLLFWGPPGCGKTITAELLAGELGFRFGVVRLSSIISSFVGETASNLQKVFNYANSVQMVLLLDEADAIAKNRDDRNDVGELKRVVNGLLQCLDQTPAQRNITVLASNHQHLFDMAVWRRFDDVVAFPLPSAAARLHQLTYLTSGLRLEGSLKEAAKKTEGASFAELERAVWEMAKWKVLTNESTVKVALIVHEVRAWRKKQAAARSSSQRRK